MTKKKTFRQLQL